jgi:hypothetical protein
MVERSALLKREIVPQQQDAFFELVEYPVRASAAANRRYFGAERYAAEVDKHPADAGAAAREARDADAEIRALTDEFNTRVAGGRWRNIMAVEPADNQWAIFRANVLALPAEGLATGRGAARYPRNSAQASFVDAAGFTANAGWRFIEGLGRGSGTLIADRPGARISYRIDVPEGTRALELGLLPLFPSEGEDGLAFDVQIDSAPARRITVERKAETPDWAQAVLDNEIRVPIVDSPRYGSTRLTITARGTGIALTRIVIRQADTPIH